MSAGTRLSTDRLSFSYGGAPVLDALTLEIPAGALVALLGPNGAGKSTLLSLASGVLKPTSGEIRLDGVSVTALPGRERARQVAMVPQSFQAPFSFTVREWVSLGRTPYLSPFRGERSEDREAVDAALARAEVTRFAGRLVGELSGGERQRVALAQALAQEPRLLLLDEATAHLDLHHQMAVLTLVRRLNREEGLTVIAAVHDLNVAALCFDRLLLLHAGALAADGTPDEVLRPDLLRQVYGSPVEVLRHPTEGVPLVALRRPSTDPDANIPF